MKHYAKYYKAILITSRRLRPITQFKSIVTNSFVTELILFILLTDRGADQSGLPCYRHPPPLLRQERLV